MQKITVHIITEKLNLKNGGASIAITDNEQIEYQNCFGFSNIESNEKINKNTRFNSFCKQNICYCSHDDFSG